MIEAESANFEVTMMCRVLGVSRSGYFYWRKSSKAEERAQRHSELLDTIEEVHLDSHGIYGSPRIHFVLSSQGVQTSVNTVARLMQSAGIAGRVRRKYRTTTDSDHGRAVARNVLKRDFGASEPDSVWCTDITAVPTKSGFVYLAVVIDVATRLVVGWSMERHMKTSLVVAALEQALAWREPAQGIIHHSDRGTQYTSKRYRKLLKTHDIRCSMSRKGNCWDNALMESFFGSYKQEWAHHYEYAGLVAARASAFEYIERFYNRHRLHSSLGYRTPAAVDAAVSEAVA